MERIKSIPPIENSDSEILILGTIPGKESFESKQYYKNEDNLFWDIMFRICNKNWPMYKEAFEEQNYEKRCQLLLQNRIALWDVIESCEETGSDRNIKNLEFNDIGKFLVSHPHIHKILFNSGDACKYFHKLSLTIPSEIECITLQSTSPSNRTNSFFILKQWKDALLNNNL